MGLNFHIVLNFCILALVLDSGDHLERLGNVDLLQLAKFSRDLIKHAVFEELYLHLALDGWESLALNYLDVFVHQLDGRLP